MSALRIRPPRLPLLAALTLLPILAAPLASAQVDVSPRDVAVSPADLGPGWNVLQESTGGSTEDTAVYSAGYLNQASFRTPRVAQVALVLSPSVQRADREVEGARQLTEDGGTPMEPVADLGDGAAYTGAARGGAVTSRVYVFRVTTAVALLVLLTADQQAGPALDVQAQALAAVQQARMRALLDVPADLNPALAYPFCRPGQVPAFQFGFAALKEQLGASMGSPLDCERAVSARGDTQQRTTTGTATYNREGNLVAFSNGVRTWALDGSGRLVTTKPPDPVP